MALSGNFREAIRSEDTQELGRLLDFQRGGQDESAVKAVARDLLFLACKEDSEKSLRFILEWCGKHDLNAVKDMREDEHGWTYLHVAAIHGCKRCVELLLGQGASADVVSSNGETPLALLLGSLRCEFFTPFLLLT